MGEKRNPVVMWGSATLVVLLCIFGLAVAYESMLHKRELGNDWDREKNKLDDLLLDHKERRDRIAERREERRALRDRRAGINKRDDFDAWPSKRRDGSRTQKTEAQKDVERIIQHARDDISTWVTQKKNEILNRVGGQDGTKLAKVFEKTFMNTIDTTVQATAEGRVFIITGDITAMWLRDSVPQVEHYLECCSERSRNVKEMLIRLVNEHAFLALQDPYANAFYDPPQFKDTRADFRRGGYVSTGNYELDSFGYSTRLAYKLWRKTGTISHFDEMFRSACRLMLVIWRKEQKHAATTTYRYNPKELKIKGIENSASKYTGMTWTGFRPSDDPCTYHYNIPDNMLTSVALQQMYEIATEVYNDHAWAEEAQSLQREIDNGIREHGIVDSRVGHIYAYEVDGFGKSLKEDDANVPSLLSIPYLNYTQADKTVFDNTIKYIWSADNPWYFEGKHAEGIGSSHTGKRNIWHMSMIMKGIISKSGRERERILRQCLDTDAGTDLMHESFNPNDPRRFTRKWFAWANSLFGYWVMQMLDEGTLPSSFKRKEE